MGAYTCEYGIVHKVCRCPTPHKISCDTPKEHAVKVIENMPYHNIGERPCWRMANNRVGKHEYHEAHDYFFTSTGGGHELSEHDPLDKTMRDVAKHRCPGNLCD